MARNVCLMVRFDMYNRGLGGGRDQSVNKCWRRFTHPSASSAFAEKTYPYKYPLVPFTACSLGSGYLVAIGLDAVHGGLGGGLRPTCQAIIAQTTPRADVQTVGRQMN